MVPLQKDPKLITVTGGPDIMRGSGEILSEKYMRIHGANSQQVILIAKVSPLRGSSGSIESCGKLMLVISVYGPANGSLSYPMCSQQFLSGVQKVKNQGVSNG